MVRSSLPWSVSRKTNECFEGWSHCLISKAHDSRCVLTGLGRDNAKACERVYGGRRPTLAISRRRGAKRRGHPQARLRRSAAWHCSAGMAMQCRALPFGRPMARTTQREPMANPSPRRAQRATREGKGRAPILGQKSQCGLGLRNEVTGKLDDRTHDFKKHTIARRRRARSASPSLAEANTFGFACPRCHPNRERALEGVRRGVWR